MTTPRSLPLVALVLVTLVVLISAPLIAGGRTWSDVRYHTQVAPPRIAAAEAVQGGDLPEWWEGSGLGVPLAAEPSHGALYPLGWLASSLRMLDLIAILHLAIAALGIALWARRRGASEPAAVTMAVLAVASGLFASFAMRGVLPALALLPWIGFASSVLDTHRVRATVGLAFAIGLVGLAGPLGVLADAVAIAVIVGRTRALIPIGAGLAIASVQWIPAALMLGEMTGSTVHGLPPSRFLELVVPGMFGGDDGVQALAGTQAWAPSLFVGAALFAVAAVRIPARRMLGLIGALVVLVLVGGRGGWPAWLGAPEVHLGALVVVLAAEGAPGIDDLLAGKRRAILALAAGAACTAIAVGAIVVLNMQQPSPRIERAILDGAISVVCLIGALALTWKQLAKPAVLALLLVSSVSAIPSTARTIDRDVVTRRPAFAPPPGRLPTRVFRPLYMADVPKMIGAREALAATADRGSLDEAMPTLVGESASLWGLAAARSEDPARPARHDATWLAAAREGGALLDRFGIELAILPSSLVTAQKLAPLATRGKWSLVRLPVAPHASVLRGALWSVDPENALDLMYPQTGGTGVLRGTVVLEGRGPAKAELDRGDPIACEVERWDAGAIDVACTSDGGYAVVSSSAMRGWSVTVDGAPADWLRADVLRRAVRIEAGTHRISWRYTTPGLKLGGLLAAIALLGLVAFALTHRARRTR